MSQPQAVEIIPQVWMLRLELFGLILHNSANTQVINKPCQPQLIITPAVPDDHELSVFQLISLNQATPNVNYNVNPNVNSTRLTQGGTHLFYLLSTSSDSNEIGISGTFCWIAFEKRIQYASVRGKRSHSLFPLCSGSF